MFGTLDILLPCPFEVGAVLQFSVYPQLQNASRPPSCHGLIAIQTPIKRLERDAGAWWDACSLTPSKPSGPARVFCTFLHSSTKCVTQCRRHTWHNAIMLLRGHAAAVQGGALVVRHGGKSKRFDLAKDSNFHICYAAFYAGGSCGNGKQLSSFLVLPVHVHRTQPTPRL